MSSAIQQIIESQRMLLNALESMMRETNVPSVVKIPPIVHARQDEMSPEEELIYMNYVEDERQSLLKQAARDKRTLDHHKEQQDLPEISSEESEEEPVLLQHVVDTMDFSEPVRDTTRGLDQRELMDALNL